MYWLTCSCCSIVSGFYSWNGIPFYSTEAELELNSTEEYGAEVKGIGLTCAMAGFCVCV